MEYADDNRVYISNIDNPFGNTPHSIWQEKIKIVSFTGNMDRIVYNHIGPCVESLSLKKDDDYKKDRFRMFIDFGLDGVIRHITFAYSTEIEIPLSVIEDLEAALIKGHKLHLEFRSPDLGDVKYINVVRSYSLYYIVIPYKFKLL